MNLLQHINLSRAPRLPLVLASEVSECGLACIAMIARFHGHDIDLNGLRQRFALSLSGMSLRSLMGLADQLGLSSRPLRVELAALSKVKTPAILHWDLNHYVVLRSVTSRSIVIHRRSHRTARGSVEALHRRRTRAYAGYEFPRRPRARAGAAVEPVVADDGLRDRLPARDRTVHRAADRRLRRAVPDPARDR